MNKDKIVSIIVVLVVLGAVAYGLFGMDNSIFKSASANVATVNGVAITKAVFDTQLNTATESFKQQGVDVASADNAKLIKDQVLNDLISNELVMQEIAKLKITATEEEVAAQFQTVETQAGGKEALVAELAKASITEVQFRTNIARQIAIQKYLSQNIDTTGITVSDAEIQAFYNENGGTAEGAPALTEVKAQITQQVTVNKQQALIATFVATLREKATVVVTLE